MEVKIKRYRSGKRNGSVRKIDVKLDSYDHWCIPWTISHIMTPLLIQLKEKKHGYGMIEKEDVPESLHATYEENGFSEEAYNWVLDELIWMFTEVSSEEENEPKMYEHIGEMQWSDPDENGNCTLISSGIKIIPEMEVINKAYHARIKNAWRLFGIYAQTLWD